MTGADVRAVVQVELVELRDGTLEELRVGLCIEVRRGLSVLEAVVGDQEGRGMRRGDIRICRFAGGPPVSPEVGHVRPLSTLAICCTGIESGMSQGRVPRV